MNPTDEQFQDRKERVSPSHNATTTNASLPTVITTTRKRNDYTPPQANKKAKPTPCRGSIIAECKKNIDKEENKNGKEDKDDREFADDSEWDELEEEAIIRSLQTKYSSESILSQEEINTGCQFDYSYNLSDLVDNKDSE